MRVFEAVVVRIAGLEIRDGDADVLAEGRVQEDAVVDSDWTVTVVPLARSGRPVRYGTGVGTGYRFVRTR